VTQKFHPLGLIVELTLMASSGFLVVDILVTLAIGRTVFLTEATLCVVQVGINYCFLLPSGIFAIKR
jgi:hypothetical protein